MKSINKHIIGFFLIFIFINYTTQDYIRSDEIVINDNLDQDTEIIDLIKLLAAKKQQTHLLKASSLVFRLVEDTPLIDFIQLDCFTDEKCSVFLRQKLDFDQICESSPKSVQNCSQLLKIIEINQNDFIEIPIEIVKTSPNQRKTVRVQLKFLNNQLNFNLSSESNIFYLNQALVQNFDEYDQAYPLSDYIKYELESSDVFKTSILKLNNGKIRLELNFTDQNAFLNANNQSFNLKLAAYLSFENSLLENDDFYIFDAQNSTQNLALKVCHVTSNSNDETFLKPLEFDNLMYSIKIDNSIRMTENQIVLQPKVKTNAQNLNLFCSIKNDKDGKSPFYVDSETCAIRLKKSLNEILADEKLNSNEEKIFSFGLKVTYQQLVQNNKENTNSTYYNDYIIPGFTKIEILLKNENNKQKSFKKDKVPKIFSEFLTPFLSRYEILNEDSVNQTFILYVNDPIQINSKLVKFFIKNDSNMTSNHQKWLIELNESKHFQYDLNTNMDSLTLINKNEFKDQNTYKTNIRLAEEYDKTILTDINIEFRIDFDPILFEKKEYTLHLSQANVIEQNLINIRVKERLNKNYTNNVLYRIKEELDFTYFDLNPVNGWLRVKQHLSNSKNYYEIVIIATNNDLQKSGQVKCKIYVECFTTYKNNITQSLIVKYNIFDNSSNRTQIGIFKSVCNSQVNTRYVYSVDSSQITMSICSKLIKNLCKKFLIDQQNKTDLLRFDSYNSYLMTNEFINVNQLAVQNSLDSNEEFDLNSDDVLDSNFVSFQLKANLKNEFVNLNYTVEINVNSMPKLTNFNKKLALVVGEAKPSNQRSNLNCLYNYKFLLNEESDSSNAIKNRNIVGFKSGRLNLARIFTNSLSSVPRFVRIDENLGHSEAEFKFDECSASFFIHNNGCLALRHDHMEKNERCTHKLTENYSNNYVILKSGTYHMNFKLCFYNNNKVSCSRFYNQSIKIDQNLYKMSRVYSKILSDLSPEADRLQTKTDHILNKIKEKNSPSILKRNYSLYIISVFGVVILVALIAISLLLVMFLRPKNANSSDKKGFAGFSTSSKSSSASSSTTSAVENHYKNNILEVSCETNNSNGSSSNSNSGGHTPETSSNAPTTSSKLSKIEDEEEEDQNHQNNHVKIQVSDNPPNYNNYAGSFSSIGSTSSSTTGAASENHRVQGLYSVKNASIQYNISNNLILDNTLSSNMNTNINQGQIMTEAAMIRNLSPIECYKANLVDVYNVSPTITQVSTTSEITNINNFLEVNNNYSSAALNSSTSSSIVVNKHNQQQQQQQQQFTKINSLKQLKKELALKKASNSNYANINQNYINNDSNNNNFYESTIQYLNNSNSNYGVLSQSELSELNTNEVIASVV
jgi:hypothetical protein